MRSPEGVGVPSEAATAATVAQPAPHEEAEKGTTFPASPDLRSLPSPPPAAAPARGGRRPRIRLGDIFLPASLVLWFLALRGTDVGAMNDYGLLPAFPLAFFAALALLVVSFVWSLARDRLSPLRLAAHVVALVLMLHGTVPLLFPLPRYSWVYKHFGVVQYINLHGAVDPRVDIYHNWPAFFAVAAWLTKVAGVASPLSYAAWAQVYFNLLICLELAYVLRSVPASPRLRWLVLFLFVCANWVGQDYFAPQAMAFVLSLAVFGIVLRWSTGERRPRWVGRLGRLAERVVGQSSPDPAEEPPALPPTRRRARVAALAGAHAIFAVIVVTHQLSPYMVISGIALLTVTGVVRPRWLVVGMAGLAIATLLPRLDYLNLNYQLLEFAGRPFHNAQNTNVGTSQGQAGRVFVAHTARVLSLGIWALAWVGIARRVRQRVPALAVALLAGAPALVTFGQSYGGELIYRIFLFSLPWTALLAASAILPKAARWSRWGRARVATVLCIVLALFLPAYFGLEEINQMRPGEVEASDYLYSHASPGSTIIFAAPNFPVRVGARYDLFQRVTRTYDPNLLSMPLFRQRMLGKDDLDRVARVMRGYEGPKGTSEYLAFSTSGSVYARVFKILPDGSLESLEQAVAQSPDWRLFYRNQDAAIYEYLGPTRNNPGPGAPR